MDLKKYDDINIPDSLNRYIDEGLEKGEEYVKNNKSKYKPWGKAVAGLFIASAIGMTTVSNIPVIAQGLVNIPIIGKVVKVLDFTNSTAKGGEITDGAEIIVDSAKENTIDIYFKAKNQNISNAPNYKVEYREYPYGLVFEFNGVREFDFKGTEELLKTLPFVSDFYSIMTLDDSAYRFAVEFSQDVEVIVSEYKEPGMIQVTVKEKQISEEQTMSYFVRSEAMPQGEEIAHFEEILFRAEGKSIQKTIDEKYIVQFGPYASEEEAEAKIKEIEEIGIDTSKLYIEERLEGERPE